MSVQPKPVPPVPAMTTQVAKAAFPKGNVYMQMRDVFGTFFTDDQFVDLYAKDGQPSLSSWRLALVCVMQFAENLTDRQAADAVRARIDWKYALSLELDDAGFDFSALSEFRQRLVESPDVERLFNRMLEAFQTHGLLQSGGRQRTDSTHIVAAVRRLNHVETVGQTLYHALNTVAIEAPEWLQAWVPPGWYDRYSQPFSDYHLPKDKAERETLALTIGQDGHRLLDALWNDPQVPAHLRQLKAIQTLQRMWIEQFYHENGQLRWRKRKNAPPVDRMLQSPFDLEARYCSKRSLEWVGYRVHLTETCNEDKANLITHVETTSASQSDHNVIDKIHQNLQCKNCLPDEHLTDAGYGSAAQLVNSKRDYGIELICPVVEPAGWQAKAEKGFALSNFHIDWDNQKVTCPEGKTSSFWNVLPPRRGHEEHLVRFSVKDCRPCLSKSLCTKGRSRMEFPRYSGVQSSLCVT